jgi:ABC-2 type transport system permease protein
MMRELTALTRREYLKIARNPQALVTSLMLPILYLFLFGQGFNLNPSGFLQHPTAQQLQAFNYAYFRGAPNYYSYFAVGMVGFTAVTATLFIGANVIFDKLFGIFKRTRGTPAPSAAVFGSRLIAGATQPVLLALMVVGIALLFAHIPGLSGLVVTASVGPAAVVEILLAIVLLSLMFATLFLMFGILLEVPQTYFAAVNAINLPVLLTSDALYPWGSMPEWLRTVSSYNPVSLAVNTMRENLFGASAYPYPPEVYLGGLAVWTAVLVGIAIVLVGRALRPVE